MNPIEYRRNQAVENDEYNQLRLRAWGREDGFDWQPVLCRSLGWITAHAAARLIGFVNVAWDGGGHMFLLDTTVDPEYQRRGIGTELVRRAIELSAEAGGDWLHVDSDEGLMRDFYGPCGFEPTPAGLVNLHAVRGGMPPGEERLDGGARWPISREGDVVYKAAGPWTPAVHALLRHLEAVGFTGAPRLVGPGIASDGREMLSFIEGATVHPHAWTDEGVAAAGRLLRRLHDATASFEPPPDAVWQRWGATVRPGPDDPDRIIGHCDTGPWNLIARNGLPVAWGDWEFAGPVNRLDEVAATAFLNCQLHDDDVAERNGLPPPEERARHLAIFCGAYGLEDRLRERLVERMVEVAVRGAARDAKDARISPETTAPIPLAWGVAWQVRSAAWMLRHRRLLEDAVRRRTGRRSRWTSSEG
jgi:GNAT superfamily N-acetyltransferase